MLQKGRYFTTLCVWSLHAKGPHCSHYSVWRSQQYYGNM